MGMFYVLRYEDKYVTDFGDPKPKLTSNLAKAAWWNRQQDIREDAYAGGFTLDKKYTMIRCELREV